MKDAPTSTETGPTSTDAEAAPAPRQRRRRNVNRTSPVLQRHEDGIFRLWDDLSDFGPGVINDALKHCMRTISG